MKAKFKPYLTYTGRVQYKGHTHERQVQARTKREAVTRLRRAFREGGVPTQPDTLTDLLTVNSLPIGHGYRWRHPEKSHTLPPRTDRSILDI
jgi:hypothetical protein